MIFSLTLVSAVSIEPVKQGEDVLLYQTCNNCTSCNITRAAGPENNTLLSNVEMDKDGTFYSFLMTGGNTTIQGDYKYFYNCGNEAETETGRINFEVTPSGRNGSDNIALVIIMIVMIYAVTFVCFFGKNIPLSILTGMMMSFFGLYIVRNGIVIYRDNLTNYFGYATLAIGGIIALWAAIEWIEEIF